MEQLAEVPDDVMESDENYQIVISGWQVYIPELGLNLHEGVYCNYDEEEGGYLPDFAITVVKEEGQTEEEWIYYEQDGFLITLANYLHGKIGRKGSSDIKKNILSSKRTEKEELMEYSIQLNAVNNPEKSVRAFATVVFGDSFKVTNVAVLEGGKGNFVSMPSFRTKERDEYNNPVYKDVCNPITKEFREELYSDILKLYEEMEQTGKAEVYLTKFFCTIVS